jgi:DNA helicase-2/ATP-dependent DNA helicase PcrA
VSEFGLAEAAVGSVVAPAGCGKTAAIVDLVRENTGKPPLVLTHTNAGVAALHARLKRWGAHRFCRLSTLDAWSLRVVGAFAVRAGYRIDPLDPDYAETRSAALRVLRSGAIDRSLIATYSSVLIDEYQDCCPLQHQLALELADRLPVRVYGDPMQAIFDFDGPVVDWTAVEAAFRPLPPLLTPWRWDNARCGRLGAWLLEARGALERGEALDLGTAPAEYVRFVPKDGAQRVGEGTGRKAGTVAEGVEAVRGVKMRSGERLLIIGHTSSDASRHELARRAAGISIVERADLPGLVEFGRRLSTATDRDRLDFALALAAEVMTDTNTPQLKRRIDTLLAGRARTSATTCEQAALGFLASPTPRSLASVLTALKDQAGCRVFRRELLGAAVEALSAARNFEDVQSRSVAVRDCRRFGSQHLPPRALGTTLLLKGLEADHVVVLDADRLSARHLYVAITRGAQSLTVQAPDKVIRPTVLPRHDGSGRTPRQRASAT